MEGGEGYIVEGIGAWGHFFLVVPSYNSSGPIESSQFDSLENY